MATHTPIGWWEEQDPEFIEIAIDLVEEMERQNRQ